jgi:hypothetical protein
MTTPVDPTGPPHAVDDDQNEVDRRLADRPDVAHRSPSDPDAAVIAIREICPYLTATSGSWRSATPNRDHRCGAVDPPGLLSIEKQRRLCLSVDHGACAAFRAARAGRAAILAPGLDPTAVAVADASRRPVARTAAVVLERPRFTMPTTRWPLDRALTQAALIGLMVLAFGAVAVSRFGQGDGAGAPGSPSASPSASATAPPRPTRRPTPSPSASASASAGASAAPSGPSASAQASFRAQYRVQSGDTLVEIAAQFDTTVAAIQEANGLTGSDLRIGQVLNIP